MAAHLGVHEGGGLGKVLGTDLKEEVLRLRGGLYLGIWGAGTGIKGMEAGVPTAGVRARFLSPDVAWG